MLREAQPQHQPGDDDDPAADAEQPANRTGDQTEHYGVDQGHLHAASVGGTAAAAAAGRDRSVADGWPRYSARVRILLLVIALIAGAGCSAAPGDDSAPPSASDPVQVTSEWLSAVSTGDATRLASLVEPRGLAVVAAVENNLRSDELVGLLESGTTAEPYDGYWAQFASAFAVFSGSGIDELTVGDPIDIPGSDDFIAVALTSQEAAGRVILRQGESGWLVDFSATVGPALVGPLGEYLSAVVSGENAAAIAAAYRDSVVPGLDAVLALEPENSLLEFETEYIRQLAQSVPATP